MQLTLPEDTGSFLDYFKPSLKIFAGNYVGSTAISRFQRIYKCAIAFFPLAEVKWPFGVENVPMGV